MMSSSTDRDQIARDYGSGGVARTLLGRTDWSAHPLGPVATWPAALRMTLRYMLSSPESMYLVWGPDGSFFFNDAYAPILGPRIDVATGARFDELWVDAYPSVEPYVRKALAGEASRVVDMPAPMARRGKPERTWWTFSYSPVFDEAGAVAGALCLTTETTEHVLRAEQQSRAAAALAASERSLRRAQEAGKIGIFSIDTASNELVGTDEFFRLFGLPIVPHISAAAIERLVVPEDSMIISHADGRAAESIALHVEYRIRRPDTGELRCIERRAEFERDAEGRAIRLVGVVQDVTERRRVREELASLNATLEARVKQRTAERNLLATIVEETDNAVHVIDADYRWLAINHAGALEFERIFGTRPRVGDHILDLLRDQPEERAAVEAVWSRALAGEEFTTIAEFGDPRRADDRHTYEMKFNTLRDDDGNRIGAFQVITDITARVRADIEYLQMQEALRQSQKMEAMGQLTGGVAHDFNNLLTPIIGSLDLLQRRGRLSDRERRLVDGALQSAERAKTLVQRLLAFARRQPLQPGPVDIAALLDGMADLIASTSGPQIKVQTDVPDALPPALADPNQLEMAILNLCVNARDAMPQGGTISIAARVEPMPADGTDRESALPAMRLSVIDTGIGMDEETARRAVEPFYSTKGIGKGTGLGLSMVHGLALQLGGTMAITSRPGAGTRIDLWLPLSTGALPALAEPVPEAMRDDVRGRALVVDDELLVRMTTADMLQSLGYQTDEVDSAAEAERRLEAGERFDLVVTDHLMPGISGVQLAQSIRRRWPELPVLIVSGYADVDGIAPDLPRLAKPFREAELAHAIAGLG